jgi:hypothetical protein
VTNVISTGLNPHLTTLSGESGILFLHADGHEDLLALSCREVICDIAEKTKTSFPNDLTIRATLNDSSSQDSRHKGGSEVGLTVGR